MEYEFQLKFVVPQSEWDADGLVDRLGHVGCMDALVGIGLPGRLALDFSRGAATAEAAILSAIKQVKAAVPSATLVEVGPDFVGLSDIADLLDVTRQNVRKFAFKRDDFPVPFHSGTTVLWRLLPVLDWFSATRGYSIDRGLRDVCSVAMQVNSLRAPIRRTGRIERELAGLVRPERATRGRRSAEQGRFG
jgi:hypothetical protein